MQILSLHIPSVILCLYIISVDIGFLHMMEVDFLMYLLLHALTQPIILNLSISYGKTTIWIFTSRGKNAAIFAKIVESRKIWREKGIPVVEELELGQGQHRLDSGL